jgi:hypothetical protein
MLEFGANVGFAATHLEMLVVDYIIRLIIDYDSQAFSKIRR